MPNSAKSKDIHAITVSSAIRIGFIGLLAYWSFRVITPFLTIGLWSAVLAVALYPLFTWCSRGLSPRLAAMVVTAACLMIVIGPVTWLGLSTITNLRFFADGVGTAPSALPLPPDAIKEWPVVGAPLHQLWSLAATNMKVALAEALPMLKPLGGMLLAFAQSSFFALLELLVSIVVAGFLFPRGPQLVEVLCALLNRVVSQRGYELVQLAGATIRNVSQGVIGKPLLMARGLTTPAPVIMIGVIGGAVAFGFAGLFFGPIVLSVAWSVMAAWVNENDQGHVHGHPAA